MFYWRKLHPMVDVDTQEIVSSVLAENDVGDGEVIAEMLGQLPIFLSPAATPNKAGSPVRRHDTCRLTWCSALRDLST